MFHAPMGRFRLELVYFIYLFSHHRPTQQLCISFRLYYDIFNRSCRVLKFLLSPGLGSWHLEFKSLIISIFGFRCFLCSLSWAFDFGIQIPSSVIWTPRSTAQAKQQEKFRNPTIEIIRDLNSNCQLPKPGDRRNFNTLQDLLKMSR